MNDEQIHIQLGLPEGLRQQAAVLYDEAFGPKFAFIIPTERERQAILAQSFHGDLALVAIRGDQLVGLAGFCVQGRTFTNAITARQMISQLGWWRAIWVIALFALLERRPEAGQLLMDGLAVHASARGQGVGTQLLARLVEYAQQHHYQTIRLDVIDTNPRARQLYERLGFVATRTESHPYLQRFMGFSASTTMIKQVG